MKMTMTTKMLLVILIVLVLGAVGIFLYASRAHREQAVVDKKLLNENTMGTLTLTSIAFGNNAMIPRQYTCQGAEINPPLTISGIPAGTQTLALVVDDPDAPVGVWDHWVVWNIDPASTAIAENNVPAGAAQGSNSSRQSQYQGPCPPSGTHHYRFTLYAVSAVLSLAPGSTKQELLSALQGKILDQYTLVGLYQKS